MSMARTNECAPENQDRVEKSGNSDSWGTNEERLLMLPNMIKEWGVGEGDEYLPALGRLKEEDQELLM